MVKRARVRTQEEVDRLRERYSNVVVSEFKELTHKEKYFLYLLVYNHYEQWRAYEVAYPARNGNERTEIYLYTKARQLLDKPNVKRRYKEMEEELQEQLQEKALWTREQATKELLEMIQSNKDEKKRIEETYNAELDSVLLDMQNAKSPNEQKKLLNQAIAIRKKVRNNSVNNSGILNAVSELNKLHGYNSQEITIKKEEYELDKKLAELPIEDLMAMAYGKNEQ